MVGSGFYHCLKVLLSVLSEGKWLGVVLSLFKGLIECSL